MHARERVHTTLAHREPDRVPHSLLLTKELRQRVADTCGNGPEPDYAEYFEHDVRFVSLPNPPPPAGVPAPEWRPAPTQADVSVCAGQTAGLQARGLAVCGSYRCGVYEQLKHWHGDVEAMTMPYDDPHRLESELDRITEWKSSIYCAYARSGVDIVWMGDDLGSQRALIMSPELYRRWYRPRHRRIVEDIRRIRSDVYIAFHCCGYVTPLIPDLIEIGIDILQAVQAETMDIAHLKKTFGRDISFWGAVGAQSVLARTTPEQVKDGVRRTLEIMAPGGGYIASACHTLTEEVPWPSIVAFHEAVRQYGRYPLDDARRPERALQAEVGDQRSAVLPVRPPSLKLGEFAGKV
ncbi:MAG: hypothetical protein JXR37_35085 [Kiritimatiellae bacterium]|nr:hypothetical protein [Kiritimatiellia bacterium]